MECPRDHREMTVLGHVVGFALDKCPGCQGVWLDKGELEAVRAKVEADLEARELEAPAPVDAVFSVAAQRSREAIDCPRCGATMTAKEYEEGATVIVDVCPKGCGVWLDRDELGALEAFFQKSKYDDDMMWATLTSVFGG